MLNYDFSKMLFKISADRHSVDQIRKILLAHPEIRNRLMKLLLPKRMPKPMQPEKKKRKTAMQPEQPL